MSGAPTTDDIGAAIRDALELLDGVELDAEPDAESFAFDHVDDSDLSNLRLVTAGAVYVVRIIREG